MAVPKTLCHPFATAKIVVGPGTCSVRRGLIIAARSCGNTTLCACWRRGERTGNHCDRDKGSKCLLHSRPSRVCLACRHRRTTQRRQEIPAAARNPPAGHRIRSTEFVHRGRIRVAYSIMPFADQLRIKSPHSKMPWPMWVVPIAVAASSAVRPRARFVSFGAHPEPTFSTECLTDAEMSI
jgi:hypothetical protein